MSVPERHHNSNKLRNEKFKTHESLLIGHLYNVRELLRYSN